MSGVNFQYRAFLLMPLLCLCLLQVKSYTWNTWNNGESITIDCKKNKSLDSTSPTKDTKHNINKTLTPTTLTFQYCSPPNKPFLEILKDINVKASNVSEIWFSEMTDTYLLKESLFEGMPIKSLWINEYYYVFNNPTEKLDLAKCFAYSADCYSGKNNLIDGKAIFPNRSLNVTIVTIDRCTPPNEPYSDILLKLKIMPSSVQELILKFPKNISPFQPVLWFKGLSLKKLSVTFDRVYELDPKVFQELETDEVYLERVEIKTLRKFGVKKVTMQSGKFFGEWCDCSTLTSLDLNKFIIPQTPYGWLHRCHNLTDLTLKSISKEGIEETLLGAHALNTLSIENTKYTSLTKPFAAHAVNLRSLKINHCVLHNISVDAFSALKKLEELDILGNNLSWLQIAQAITPLQNLRKLTMDGNAVGTFCEDFNKCETPSVTSKLILD